MFVCFQLVGAQEAHFHADINKQWECTGKKPPKIRQHSRQPRTKLVINSHESQVGTFPPIVTEQPDALAPLDLVHGLGASLPVSRGEADARSMYVDNYLGDAGLDELLEDGRRPEGVQPLPLHRLHSDDDALADSGVLSQAVGSLASDSSDPFPLPHAMNAVRVQ